MSKQTNPPPTRRHQQSARFWERFDSADRLGRLAAAAERRTTPRRAVTGLVAVTTLAAVTLALLTGWPSSVPADQSALVQARVTPEMPEPAPRDLPRARAAEPAKSPPGPPPAGSDQPAGDFVGWAVMDLSTGAVTGSDTMADTSTTASMIKAWLVADYLRRTDEAGDTPSQARLDQLSIIIRDSANEPAQDLFEEIGRHASIDRLISICGLTDSRAIPNYWSNTQLSARDTARMGACLADGGAAGPEWTSWLLDEMRGVRGVGDFGIRHGLPADQRPTVAIKNGWVIRSDEDAWHVNCLAIGDGWSMGVMTRYPANLGYEHGAELCRSLAEQHLA